MSSDSRHRENEGTLTEMEFSVGRQVVMPKDPGQLGKA